MLADKTIKLFLDTGIHRTPARELMEALEEHGHFSLFLEFVDPVADKLVQDYFPFYPKQVNTFTDRAAQSWSFLTRYRDMLIRIPSDPEWWYRQQNSTTPTEVLQKTTSLHKGELREVSFTVTIPRAAIRLLGDETWRSILAKHNAA